MNIAISDMGCNLLASIIYDIGKVCLGKFRQKPETFSMQEIETLVREKIDQKYEILYMSGIFESFLKSPIFLDTIENYILYRITGCAEGSIRKVKKSNNPITEKDVVEFLSKNLIQIYNDEQVISKPSKTLIRQFFDLYFSVATKYVMSLIKDENEYEVYFINHKIDSAEERILIGINDIIDTLKRTMECEIIPVVDKYEDYVNEYHRILKMNHSKAHVYLLDTFDFAEFYVPPLLSLLSSRYDKRYNNSLYRQYISYSYPVSAEDKNELFEDWKHIFDSANMVYVTGGAGYGKSLFLKKMINDFQEMNILNSSNYLVIYGDLKTFYIEGEQPVSVVRFLQISMVKETLMDETCFPKELIEYYLKMGRCFILLDALDEVEKQKREELHKKLVGFFRNQNPNNRICITSRNRGFIPEKDVEVYDIMPLDRLHIEKYVDNIIKLGRFDAEDKQAFLDQSSVLMDKGFLNSFLVLSLLINIYKAERELPENKMELYQKCFDYIAYKREKEKTRTKYDWKLISGMMKDNTFMELAKMCFPNNTDIGKDEIVEMLCKTYSTKYSSMAETESAADNFLAFCSDRTELFVPAAGEERFKFFHRSFFEYFYAQFIFLRVRSVDEEYELLQRFDVDSEVFELTLAMMKQKDEYRYQELVEYIFNIADEEIKRRSEAFNAFNILTLGMQVIDDSSYICRYIDFIVRNRWNFVKNIEHIPNQTIIYNVITGNEDYVRKVVDEYEFSAKFFIVTVFLEQFSDSERIGNEIENYFLSGVKSSVYVNHKLIHGLGNMFYVRLYFQPGKLRDVLKKLSENELIEIMSECKTSKKIREKYLKAYGRYSALDEKKRDEIVTVFSSFV